MKECIENIGLIIDLMFMVVISPLSIIVWIFMWVYHIKNMNVYTRAFMIVPFSGILELSIDELDCVDANILGYEPITRIFKK